MLTNQPNGNTNGQLSSTRLRQGVKNEDDWTRLLGLARSATFQKGKVGARFFGGINVVHTSQIVPLAQ